MGARLAPNARLFAVQAVLLCTLFGVEHGTAPSSLLGVMLFSVTLGLQNGVITALHNVSFHSTFVSGDLTKLLKPAKPQHSADSGTASNRMLVLLIAGFGGGALLASTLQRMRPSMAVPMFLLILAMAFGSATFPIK